MNAANITGPYGDKNKLMVVPSEDFHKLKAAIEFFLNMVKSQGLRDGMTELARITTTSDRLRTLVRRRDKNLTIELFGCPEFKNPCKMIVLDSVMAENLLRELNEMITVRRYNFRMW